ncbi:MAG: 2-amino-4-hydroxy-6-hydroxymethyldihydropteridine diphosphokinase [Coriobacteriia bacterium]|jgi:2-amino-4-hydroxy-6-hydroxymethyldihydropteridine diphosphokinase|nr:2-amino-4-hydroxy-6-hydroxymethyldihydropteridine diphosphokinase [Coriobacteriia bacterium]
MTRAHIALGANLGDRLTSMASALSRIGELDETVVLAVSRVYESEAWPDADASVFANAVAVVETGLAADALLEALHEIEEALGRERGTPNAPRSIDLDIILFGSEEWDTPALQIPHPRFQEREFVTRPLLEVDARATLPDGSPAAPAAVLVGRIVKELGALPGFEHMTHGPGSRAQYTD